MKTNPNDRLQSDNDGGGRLLEDSLRRRLLETINHKMGHPQHLLSFFFFF